MRGASFTLVTITNPNPNILIVWRSGKLQDTLRPHDQIKTPITEDLTLTYGGSGRALAVLQIEGDDTTDEEWVQQVSRTPVRVDPELAYERGDHA
jgi:hypothetical protein